jgi:hypothetical protein
MLFYFTFYMKLVLINVSYLLIVYSIIAKKCTTCSDINPLKKKRICFI